MAEINKIQFKRGSTLSNAGTPAAGEPIYDTSTKKLYIGDGVTAAGGATPSLVAISDDKLPLTGGTLTGDLNVTATGARLFVSSANNEVAMLGRAGSGTPSTEQGYLRLKSSGTNTVALHSAGNSYINGGSLGIGTDNPQKILHLKNASPYTYYEDTDDSKVWVSGVGGSAYNIYEDNTNLRFSIGAGGAITFNQAFTFPTSIGTAGQVLKVPSTGTTLEWGDGGGNSITGDLTVTGNGLFSGNNRTLRLGGTSSETQGTLVLGGSNSAGSRVALVANSDNSYLDSYGGEGSTERYRDFTYGARSHIFRTSSGSSLGTALTIDSSQNSTFSGNVTHGGNITTATSTDYAVLHGIQGGLRVLSSRSTDAGILWTNSSGSFRGQLYGDGTNYGFLDSHWGAWDIKKVINGDLVIRKSGSNYTVYDTQNLPSPITASNIASQSVASATAAVRINAFDNRTISPSEFGNNRVRFGFTSWANNNSSPYADAFHLSSYGDSSGGSANLIMFKKSGIGMRIWQQSFNSSTAYSSYADVMLSTGGTFTDQVTISTGGGNMLVLKDNNSSSTGTTSYVQFVDSSGTQQGYVGHGTSSNGNLFLYANNGRPILGTTSAGFQPQVYYTGNYYTIWHEGNDGSGSGLDADTVDGNHASAFVRTNTTSVITGGYALEFSPSTSGFPKVHMDARTSGSGARLHRWNRDSNNANYLPYYENWWDGNSYQSFGTENNRWVFNQQIHVADAQGNAYFGGNQSDEWGRIEFTGYSNGIYVYTNSGDFRVDGGNWNPYSDSDVSLGNSSVRWNGCHIVDWFRVYGGGGVYWNDYGHHIYPLNSTHQYWRSGSTAAVGMLMTTNGTNRGYVYANSSNEMGFLSVGGAWAFQKSVGNTYGTYSVFTGQNSWNGITYSSHSSKPTIMFKDNHGDGGLYHQGASTWRWYYAQAHTCMGINGSTTSSSYGCYITGSVYTTGSYNSSDVRLKQNIKTIDSGIEKVMNMRGVYFDWKDEHKEEKGEGRQVGVIAQEMNEVLPEAVIHAEDIDEYTVDYAKITGVLIEAIKDLKNEINELKKGCCNGS